MFDVNIQLYTSLSFVIDREEVLEDGTLVHMSKGLS
jgi:hypothetical protein